MSKNHTTTSDVFRSLLFAAILAVLSPALALGDAIADACDLAVPIDLSNYEFGMTLSPTGQEGELGEGGFTNVRAQFLSSLSRFGAGDSDVTAKDVNKRFDVLWSRVALYDSGRVGERVAV